MLKLQGLGYCSPTPCGYKSRRCDVVVPWKLPCGGFSHSAGTRASCVIQRDHGDRYQRLYWDMLNNFHAEFLLGLLTEKCRIDGL